MIDRDEVVETIRRYLALHESERSIERLLTLILSGSNHLSRTEFRGHITCSALVVNAERHVLQIHHRTLKKWLLPGGHIEKDDDSLCGAAIRELREEVGIGFKQLDLLSPVDFPLPVDIDYHHIPLNRFKNEASHYHWDFRFAFHARSVEISPDFSEISDAAWRDFKKLNTDLRSKILRLLEADHLRRVA